MLTICLVTQGREQVLEFLEGAEAFSGQDFINFLIVDNGAPAHISSLLISWCAVQPRATYVRREANTTDFNEIWPVIEKYGSEWINFPGDDDRLVLEGYLEFKNVVTNNTQLSALAMSARIIDSRGNLTGENVSPTFSPENEKGEQVALALNCPPFFWPSLFIKKAMLHSPFPKSRFVLDWWISLQLVIYGSVLNSDVNSLEYRRHGEQESNQVTLNRKFFEAAFFFDEVFSNPEFIDWIKSLSSEELAALWESASNNVPIYGDHDFGKLILFKLAKLLLGISIDDELSARVLSDISKNFGVFYHDGALSEILHSAQVADKLLGNIKVLNSDFHCPHLGFATEFLIGNKNASPISISCQHDKRASASLYLKCSEFKHLSQNQKLDKLILKVSEEFENKGLIDFKISPRERAIIRILRRIKPLMSGKVISKLRKTI